MKTITLIPISLGNFCVPPAPGSNPREVSVRPRIAGLEAILISALKASSRPPPRAGPSIEAIVGIGRRYHLKNIGGNYYSSYVEGIKGHSEILNYMFDLFIRQCASFLTQQ